MKGSSSTVQSLGSRDTPQPIRAPASGRRRAAAAPIGPVAAQCGRCGFSCRAMAGGDVTVAYPDRAAWAKLCWNRPAPAKDPLACADLAKAFSKEVRNGGRHDP